MATDLEALCTPLDNESTQPLVTLLATSRWSGSSEDQVEIRDLTVRNERLPAVNLPMGPMKLRSGLDPCYIGSVTRLRHSVGPDLLPLHHRDDEPFLLPMRPPL